MGKYQFPYLTSGASPLLFGKGGVIFEHKYSSELLLEKKEDRLP
jgi:hypothetical protein